MSIFQLKRYNTDIKTELNAGLTSFLATAYIIIVNPIILSQAGMPFSGVVTATVLVASFSSILMGLHANNPIVVAPGMGLNAFFVFTVVKGMGLPWSTALAMVFISGLLFILLSVTNLRTLIVESIPKNLRYAMACGIGLFIALIGLVNAKVIVDHPATLITHGTLNSTTLLFWSGLFMCFYFAHKQYKSGPILTIIFISLFHGLFNGIDYKGITASPNFELFMAFGLEDIKTALSLSAIPAVFAFLFTDMFDTLSTLVGVCEAGGITDEKGKPRNLKKALVADSLATTFSAIFGCSPSTSYIESASGVQVGGRTGLTAVFAGLFFLPFIFLSPLLSLIPQIATAPILVIVGVYMCQVIKKIEWEKFEEALPCFLAIILIPYSYSITEGIVWGILSYTIIQIMLGKVKTISLGLWFVTLFSVMAIIF